jgi:hypothetical protein
MTIIFRATFVWGELLAAQGKAHNKSICMPVAYLRLHDEFDSFIEFDHAEWGRTALYWGSKYRYRPANRNANKILRPVFERFDMTFPKNGARGDAFIRFGRGERDYMYIPKQAAPFNEGLEWAKANLTPGSYFLQDAFNHWLLILGDDKNDHFKAQMRWG